MQTDIVSSVKGDVIPTATISFRCSVARLKGASATADYNQPRNLLRRIRNLLWISRSRSATLTPFHDKESEGRNSIRGSNTYRTTTSCSIERGFFAARGVIDD